MLTVLMAIGSGALGGGTTHVLDLVDGLDRGRFRVAVACGTDGALAADLRARGVETFAIDFMGARLGVRAWRELARAIDAVRPAILHAHGSRAALAAAVARRFFARWPCALLYSEHGLSFERARGPLVALPAMLAERAVGTLGARAIALSRHSERLLRRFGTFTSVTVIPYMVREPPADEPDRAAVRRELGIAEDAEVVGTIMRLVPQKAPERFVELAARVRAARPGARFFVIGDGPLRPAVERAIAARGLGDAVRLLGAQPNAARFLRAFDVFALLSRWEGMPISILEAQARGVPVVATANAGVADLVRAGCGAGVPDGRVDAAARATIGFLADPRRAARTAAAARDRIRAEHDPSRILACIADRYDAAAGARPCR